MVWWSEEEEEEEEEERGGGVHLILNSRLIIVNPHRVTDFCMKPSKKTPGFYKNAADLSRGEKKRVSKNNGFTLK